MAISRLQTCCLGAVAMCLVAPGRLSAQMPDVRPCSIGYVEGNNNEKEDIVVGHNFWVTIRTDKSPVEANLTAGTWLRCAEEDLEAGEFDLRACAWMRLCRIYQHMVGIPSSSHLLNSASRRSCSEQEQLGQMRW